MNFGGGGGGNPPWARQSGASATGYGFAAANPYSAAQTLGQQTAANATNKPRVFTGTITKVGDNFGFVDEDVFFQTSVCKGGVPKLGDRVLVEASYNANMPFKWNATRIQLLPNTAQPSHVPQQIFQQVSAVQQLTALQQAQLSAQSITPVHSQGMGQIQMHHLAAHQPQQPSRPAYTSTPSSTIPKLMQKTVMAPSRSDGLSSGGSRSSRFDQRDRRDDRRNERTSERQRSPPPRKRSRSPPPRRRSRSPKAKSRSRSPKRRTTSRYSVNISPLSFDTRSCTVLDISKRYSNMYIPSDFFHLSLDWATGFSLHSRLRLGAATKFHICHRDVDPLEPFPDTVDPPDADYRYSAKVMLLAQPSMDEIYKQCCSLAENGREGDFIHPTRLLHFLVGMRAKNEPLAIGGPWSPSLDGADPVNDPRVLINTAIRTTKALTAIDLSACTQWYRFVDISYLRAEEVHKGKTIAEHTEHVVMFLPDIWSVVPAMMDYLALQAAYKRSLLLKVTPKEEQPRKDETAAAPSRNQMPQTCQSQDTAAISGEAACKDDKPGSENSASDEKNTLNTSANADDSVNESTEEKVDEEMDVTVEGGEGTEELAKVEPSHWSKLDPKTMKVIALRTELEARGISCKGLKSQLQLKLSKALKNEMEEDEKLEETGEPALTADPVENKESTEIAMETAKKEGDGDIAAGNESIVTEEKKADEEQAAKASTPEAAKPDKPEEKAPELTKEEKEKRAKDLERLRARLERCYVFPPEPTILVHPNRSAKNGKFDCSVMSLSLLLDYRPEDNKEHSFEVSLFAESFNEMLMRDFGFTIYKKLKTEQMAKKLEASKKAEVKAEIKSESNSTESEEDKKGSTVVEDSKTEKTRGSDKSELDQSTEPETKKRKKVEADDEDDRSSLSSSITERTEKSSRKKEDAESGGKMVTVDKATLLAFVYYDTTHTGYIVDKDLEEMFFTLGLQVSRSQMRELVQKFKTPQGRENVILYRKLTDQPEIAVTEAKTEVDLDIVQLAKGNRGKQKADNTEGESAEKADNSLNADGVVMFKGAVLELDKVMSRLDHSEENRLRVEQEMKTLLVQNESLTKKLESSEETVKKLTSEQSLLNEKLQSARTERDRKHEEASSLKTLLGSVSKDLHRIVGNVDRSIGVEEKERKTTGRDSAVKESQSNGLSETSSEKVKSEKTGSTNEQLAKTEPVHSN